MSLRLSFEPYILNFKFDAGTSRGVMRERKVWFVKVSDTLNENLFGIGECAPIQGLSVEDISQVEFELERVTKVIHELDLKLSTDELLDAIEEMTDPLFPSIRFALETAVLDLKMGGKRILFENEFVTDGLKIPINGLIWMGTKEFMLQQAKEKIANGFNCIKMKIGAINLEEEKEILSYIRKYGGSDLILRVDANGAFPNNEVFKALKSLSAYDIHSIEQPIMPRQHEAMSLISVKSEIPIALDEDLIGVDKYEDKEYLLSYTKAPFIVIKPSLVGGIKSTREWIKLAEEHGIGWWITSALESNIGLNVIAQLTANYSLKTHHGLGTGQLFHNNIEGPLTVTSGFISYNPTISWQLQNVFQS